MSQRLEKSEKQTMVLATDSIRYRLALYLSDLDSGNKDTPVIVKLPMTRKNLASYLGTTPESVTRNMNNLEDEGIISSLSSSEIKIIDHDRLQMLN